MLDPVLGPTQREAASLQSINDSLLDSISLNQFRIKNAGSFKAVKNQQIGEIRSAKKGENYTQSMCNICLPINWRVRFQLR